jgi:ABC-type xylose transport system substrate-binding protein
MKLQKQIQMAAEKYAAFGGDGMDNNAYFSFIKGAEYALQLIANEIKDEL